MKHSDWLVVDQERPLVLDVHGAAVGDVDVARHFRVVQDATEVDFFLLKFQVREVDLTPQRYLILIEETKYKMSIVR